jgi:hypothetical protein
MKSHAAVLSLYMLLCSLHSIAQKAERYYYNNNKNIYSTEQWNKRHSRCHFKVYYEDGRLMAEGYKRDDKYHKHEIPDSTFTVWTPDGRVVQQMTITKDSLTVITRDTTGTLRGQVWAGKRYFREEEYKQNGDTFFIHECHLPDSLDYFTSYLHYTPAWIQNNKNLRWPEPRFPIDYGIAGNDGVSAPGTFKIYARAANIIPGIYTGDCIEINFSDGKRAGIRHTNENRRIR